MTKIEFEEPWEILDSGSVIHYDSTKPLTLFIVEDDGTKMNLRLTFKKDENAEKDNVHFSQYNNDTLLIHTTYRQFLLNFGTLKPFRIGGYNGKDIYFNFRVSLSDDNDSASINYTWYLRKEASNEN